MIDFHSHILPKLDDGSKSSDMSVEMLKASYEQGITVMVATPHFYIEHNTVEKFLSSRRASYNALMKKLEGVENVPDIKLGAEVYYFTNIGLFPEIHSLCVENTDYLLLEMPFEQWTDKMMGDIEKLVYDCNITPIIAHLDRYLSLQKDNRHIKALLSMGALMQMNADYITGFFTKKNALSLIKSGVISLLGSDCHNMDKRAPNLGKALKVISSKCGEKTLADIEKNAAEILGLQAPKS